MSQVQQIDRYEVREVLGTGAMGCVYSAWDPKLQRDVALKVVTLDLSRNPKGRDRFLREVRAVAALRHPNVVEIYDYSGPESDQLYLVMEKLEGDDLFNIVEARGGMPETAAAAVGHELCLALGSAHDQGIIHRDLKPENVFIDADGRVVLTDFGIVKAVRENSAVDGFESKTEVIGTPGFMAPELMMNKPLGTFTDVFGLGALLYNITTGRMPFDGSSPIEIFRQIMRGSYEDPRRYNPMLSDDFCDSMRRMLHPKPKKRAQNVAQVREDMKAVLAAGGVQDLREDLREYMSDPETYLKTSTRRAADRLVERIKLAVKDRDPLTAESLRVRLLKIDPHNDEVDSITGLLSYDHVKRRQTRMRRASRRASAQTQQGAWWRSGRWWMLAGILVAAVVGASGALLQVWMERSKVERAAPTVSFAAPGTERPGHVTIMVRGGNAVVFVDGARVGKGRKYILNLPHGEHVIEVRSKGNRLRRVVEVPPASTMTVVAELKRGRILTEDELGDLEPVEEMP